MSKEMASVVVTWWFQTEAVGVTIYTWGTAGLKLIFFWGLPPSQSEVDSVWLCVRFSLVLAFRLFEPLGSAWFQLDLPFGPQVQLRFGLQLGFSFGLWILLGFSLWPASFSIVSAFSAQGQLVWLLVSMFNLVSGYTPGSVWFRRFKLPVSAWFQL